MNKNEVAEIESWVEFILKIKFIMQNKLDSHVLIRTKNQNNMSFAKCERMKKIYMKSLHKETFKKEMLVEFRQFSNEVISWLDQQNKVLLEFVLMQKSKNNSLKAMQNIKIEQERFSINNVNYHSEILKHHIKDRYFLTRFWSKSDLSYIHLDLGEIKSSRD